jgi:hypothetical protein
LALPFVVVALTIFLLLPKEPASINTHSTEQGGVGGGDVVTAKKHTVAEGVRQGASKDNSYLREQDIDTPQLKETKVRRALSCDDLSFAIEEGDRGYESFRAWWHFRNPNMRPPDPKFAHVETPSDVLALKSEIEELVENKDDLSMNAALLAWIEQEERGPKERIQELLEIAIIHGNVEAIEERARHHRSLSYEYIAAGRFKEAYDEQVNYLAWLKMGDKRNQPFAELIPSLNNKEMYSLRILQKMADKFQEYGFSADPVEMDIELHAKAEQVYSELNQRRQKLELTPFEEFDRPPTFVHEVSYLAKRGEEDGVKYEEFIGKFNQTLERCGFEAKL